jgi:DMSO/TMAO reductase YedYZ molybdopterin-dependent catalytic subunit
VRDLLATAGVHPGVSEVTFVSLDGFRSTVDLDGLRRFDVLLAIEADGRPIPRDQGGPIFLVFPHSSAPETVARYPERYWSYYVSHIVVGTEAPTLRIGDRVLDAASFAARPQVTRTQTVGWKVHWPSAPTQLRGVALPDLLQAAGVSLPAGGRVVVRGKAAVHRDPRAPRAIPAAELSRCPYLIVTHSGPHAEPIPARLGGPLALAVPPACDGPHAEPLWLTHVEELVIEGPP